MVRLRISDPRWALPRCLIGLLGRHFLPLSVVDSLEIHGTGGYPLGALSIHVVGGLVAFALCQVCTGPWARF